MTSLIRYAYDVKVNMGAGMLEHGGIPAGFPNCGEMLIQSNHFEHLDECEQNLARLLSALSSYETKQNNIPHVIVTKANPLLKPDEKPNEGESWDETVLLRAYIADAAELKKSNLKFFTFAQIKTIEPERSVYMQ